MVVVLVFDIVDRSEFGKSELRQSFIITSESGQLAHRGYLHEADDNGHTDSAYGYRH